MTPLPALIVVSGPAGTGKTALAHQVAPDDRVSGRLPGRDQGTTEGYAPGLEEMVALINGRG